MSPISPPPWHYTTFPEALDHWQTLIAGVLAFAAGFGTVVAAIWAIWVTRSTARKQIDASREDAERVIAATREQTETTVRLERERVSSEPSHFPLCSTRRWCASSTRWAGPERPIRRLCRSKRARRSRPFSFASASPKAGSQNCAPLASDTAALSPVTFWTSNARSTASQCSGRTSSSKGRLRQKGKHAGLGKELNEIGEKASALGRKIAERN